MKSIDVKSLLIGFLLSTTFFLTVAGTSNFNTGHYQLESVSGTLYLLDTNDGDVYEIDRQDSRSYESKWAQTPKYTF